MCALIDFNCRVCGVETDMAPDPPEHAVCEQHCEGHDYQHDPYRRGSFCIHCDRRKDWREIAEALAKALQIARAAISTCDEDAFGEGSEGELTWSIRDEIIYKLNRALAAYEKAKGGEPRG